MKKLLFIPLILLFLFCLSSLSAQIKFEHGTWTEIKAKAKAEHKLIFIDAYTTWCGPCKWMAANVFTNDTVANYYNATFVNAKIDMEAGEGKELAKLYNIHVYPSLLYIDENGDVLHRAAGSKPSAAFIQLGKDALAPEKQFASLEKKYKNGALDLPFMMLYLSALDAVYLDTKAPLNAYFNTQKEQDLSNQSNWNLINSYVNDYQSKEFIFLIKNTVLFSKQYTSDSVNNKIYNVYNEACNRLIYKDKDSLKYFQLKDEIEKSGFKRSEELCLNTDMNFYNNKKDYSSYAKAAILYIDKYQSENADVLNNIAYLFYQEIKDKEMLSKAEQWAKKSYALAPDPQLTMDTYACLLSVNGKKPEAIKLEQEAVNLIKADPNKYSKGAIPDMEGKIAEWSK